MKLLWDLKIDDFYSFSYDESITFGHLSSLTENLPTPHKFINLSSMQTDHPPLV